MSEPPIAPTTTEIPASTVWAPQRLELLQWFRKAAPGLAEAYAAAVELSEKEPFPGISQFLAHALRDIMNRLPDAVAAKAEWMDASRALDRVRVSWVRAGLPLSATLQEDAGDTPPVPDVPIPRELYGEIQDVLREHGKASERSEESARRVFRILLPPGAAVSPVVTKEWIHVRKWAASKAHFNHAAPRDTDWNECRSRLGQLETLMRGLIGPFFAISRELDEILEAANS